MILNLRSPGSPSICGSPTEREETRQMANNVHGVIGMYTHHMYLQSEGLCGLRVYYIHMANMENIRMYNYMYL